jgi:hypothetical protein
MRETAHFDAGNRKSAKIPLLILVKNAKNLLIEVFQIETKELKN